MKLISLGVTEIAGYRLLALIGSGGMGNVYQAYHTALQREAAVKILHQEEMADRFRNEAYIQSSVSHPNIARLYEYVPLPHMPCIIMEYVHGQTLDAWQHSSGKRSSSEIEQVIQQIAVALAYLHARDIVHRDIKPQNFKVQPDGTVKMLDFGIAKNKYTPKLTQLGFVAGTTAYMAPEQFHQQPEKKSDIWSLGIMTYELLTGYMPFDEHNPVLLRDKILKAVYTKPAILVPGISEKLTNLIENCLQKNTSSRFTAQQAVQLLGNSIKTRQPFLRTIKIPFFNRRQLLAIGFLLAAFVIIIAFIKNWPADIKKEDPQIKNSSGSSTKTFPGVEKRIMINTPGIDNASIFFSDGISKSLPYEITGKQGENVLFTIRANGYADKKIQVEINDRRSSYEYNLEKINE